ncbi:MCE family protein [Haloechinothrix halophila]|uniref:Virulence factor Mce family protein n=1 Tax=Haloechinothrix halophila YIM 93223 TaxID=592678 RepID=W9DNE2_9PSEU|nr:MCE family protein [Haloechinothrix halophila]ETA66435.1 virulence factor Mce family protein [Haloechinothrix halophila YIM 93223]
MWRSKSRRSTGMLAAVFAMVTSLLAGCGSFTGIYDIPLPGGADLGDDPVRVEMHFRNVLDLVPQSAVKINEVSVGKVEEISLTGQDWNAKVTVLLNGETDLPANARANVKQSSLLGEKYIELLHPPKGTGQGELTDGSVIPVSRTDRGVELEEVLGAMSMLLNGGGVEQLNTITKELNQVSTGREGEIKAFLHNAETLVQGLDGQTQDISNALDGLNRLSKALRKDKEAIAAALDDLEPGMKVLVDQRKQLVTMLESMKKLSVVATDTIQKSQRDLVNNLESLRPILANLVKAGDKLPKSLEILVSFPFPDSAVDGAKGDYFNLYQELNLNIREIYEAYRRHRGNPFDGLPVLEKVPASEGELLDPNQLPPLPLPSPSDGDSGGQSDDGLGVLPGLLGGGS